MLAVLGVGAQHEHSSMVRRPRHIGHLISGRLQPFPNIRSNRGWLIRYMVLLLTGTRRRRADE